MKLKLFYFSKYSFLNQASCPCMQQSYNNYKHINNKHNRDAFTSKTYTFKP